MNVSVYDNYQGDGSWISLDNLRNFNSNKTFAFNREGDLQEYTISESTLEKLIKTTFAGMRRNNSGHLVIDKHLIPVAATSEFWVKDDFKNFMYVSSLIHDVGEDRTKSKIQRIAKNEDHNLSLIHI